MNVYGKHELKKNLYSLKKHWGSPVVWYRLLGSSTDRRTGKMVTNWETALIRKGILLPKESERSFKYSLSYLAANKNFTYGGFFDKDKRFLLIDARDLPRNWNVLTEQVEFNDKLVIGNDRYNLSKADNYDAGLAYMLTITHIKGSETGMVIEAEVTNNLEVADETVTS